jgi:hypothetical protein
VTQRTIAGSFLAEADGQMPGVQVDAAVESVLPGVEVSHVMDSLGGV